MKGRASTYAAVTIVNGLATGLGSALSINLKLEAEVEVTEEPEVEASFEGYKPRDDRLIEASILKVFGKLGLKGRVGAKVKVRSEIPIAKGLKSSSAASNAVVLAALEALDVKYESIEDKLREALNLAVEASFDAKVTVTGALDDASASMLGGLTVADNFNRTVKRRFKLPRSIKAVLLIPEEEKYTVEVDLSKLKLYGSLLKLAWTEALEGRWREAMNLNGLVVSSALGYPAEPLFEALEAGAITASPSGKGPTLAALAEEDRVDDVAEAWTRLKGEVRIVDLNMDYASSFREEPKR